MTKKTKVLIIDDDRTLSNMYKERLELSGFEAIVSYNGESGLARAHQEKPEVILLDVMMPKKSGFQVLEELKQDQQTQDIPVILLTNLANALFKSSATSTE